MAYDEANEREFAEAEEALADKRYSGWKRAQARKAADARFFDQTMPPKEFLEFYDSTPAPRLVCVNAIPKNMRRGGR